MQGKKALIIVDMLNDFVLDDAPLRVPGIKKIIPPIKREIKNARNNSYPVIYICDSHDKDDIEFKLYPPHAVTGTDGAEIIKQLKPQNGDTVVFKKTLSGFYRTEFGEKLKQSGTTEIFLTGCVVNICIFFIAIEAVARGFKVNVIKDAVTGFSKKDYDFSLQQLSRYFKVNLI